MANSSLSQLFWRCVVAISLFFNIFCFGVVHSGTDYYLCGCRCILHAYHECVRVPGCEMPGRKDQTTTFIRVMYENDLWYDTPSLFLHLDLVMMDSQIAIVILMRIQLFYMQLLSCCAVWDKMNNLFNELNQNGRA